MTSRKNFLKTLGWSMTGLALRKRPFQVAPDELPLLEFAFTATITLGVA